MSALLETEAITQALEIIDKGLGAMHTRELVSTTEVTDLLLDMRSLLAAADVDLVDLVELGELEPAVN
ncbi:MAG: hypothetical protein ACRD1K_12030 [Acidimicrobiales bacterium]